jgi:hypothetical protein
MKINPLLTVLYRQDILRIHFKLLTALAAMQMGVWMKRLFSLVEVVFYKGKN